jgi:fructose-specific phosphotransferase system component IIB
MHKRFTAVIVIAAKDSCIHAKSFHGKKLLTTEFEKHILSKCYCSDCKCTFKTFPDRRTGNDRRKMGNELLQPSIKQRRKNAGRRANDVSNSGNTESSDNSRNHESNINKTKEM